MIRVLEKLTGHIPYNVCMPLKAQTLLETLDYVSDVFETSDDIALAMACDGFRCTNNSGHPEVLDRLLTSEAVSRRLSHARKIGIVDMGKKRGRSKIGLSGRRENVKRTCWRINDKGHEFIGKIIVDAEQAYWKSHKDPKKWAYTGLIEPVVHFENMSLIEMAKWAGIDLRKPIVAPTPV